MRATTTEASVQKSIVTLLQLHRWLVVRVNSGGYTDSRGHFYTFYDIAGLGSKGHPDLVAYRPLTETTNESIFGEVKRKGGKLRDSQKAFIEYAATLGIHVYVWDDWQAALDEIKHLARGR